MPIQASGQISIQDIRDEIDSDEDEFSLADAATGVYDTINISNLNANKPDNSTPHALSEWYKYQHTPTSITTSPGSNLNISASGASNQSISVTHRTYSTWYVSSKPSWVTMSSAQAGSSSSPRSGSGTITYSVQSNSGSSRSGTITVRCNVGTTNGTHPSGTDSFTTRNTSVSQASGEGGGGGGGGGRGEP